MAHSDEQLIKALIHDAVVMTGSALDDHQVAAVHKELVLAELLLQGKASDEDRASVADLVHASTRSHYLPDQ